MKLKKLLALFPALALLFTGCSGNSGDTSGVTQIYFLNFKPEIAQIYQNVAADYEAETGIRVKVVTAAANTYETTLKSEIAKSDAPTIFQVNGPVGFETWKDYCADLSGSRLYSWLSDKTLAVTRGDGVYAIPYAVEGYGILYNDAIMRRYFSLPDKASPLSSAEEITDFSALKTVVEDMTAHKEELGIRGVFASTSLGSGEQWRWQSHLANVPFYYEMSEKPSFDSAAAAGLESPEFSFKYADNFKNLFDLYLNNSVTAPTLLGGKSVADSMAEFALGQAAMVQNGNWSWAQISSTEGNTVSESDIRFLPLYTGMPGEKSQGICVGTENYLAVNSRVSEEKQAASIAFLEWLFSSETGKRYVTEELSFLTPFTTFSESQRPADPLAREVIRWMGQEDSSSVPWAFSSFPSEEFKNRFGSALLEYAQGSLPWEDVVRTVQSSWASEYAAAHR